MFEVLNYYRKKIDSSEILFEHDLEAGQYFLVSAHREENIESDLNFGNLVNTLNSIAEVYDLTIIVSTHPRTKKRIEAFGTELHKNIRLLKPVGFTDYNMLQLMAKATLSDSGTINEESSILNFPALNIREAHERPEGRDETSILMSDLTKDKVLKAINLVTNHHKNKYQFKIVADYDVDNVSKKVVRIIYSYTDYVNRTVWRKDL